MAGLPVWQASEVILNNHFAVGLDLHFQCRAIGHPTPQAYM